MVTNRKVLDLGSPRLREALLRLARELAGDDPFEGRPEAATLDSNREVELSVSWRHRCGERLVAEIEVELDESGRLLVFSTPLDNGEPVELSCPIFDETWHPERAFPVALARERIARNYRNVEALAQAKYSRG